MDTFGSYIDLSCEMAGHESVLSLLVSNLELGSDLRVVLENQIAKLAAARNVARDKAFGAAEVA